VGSVLIVVIAAVVILWLGWPGANIDVGRAIAATGRDDEVLGSLCGRESAAAPATAAATRTRDGPTGRP